MNISMDNGFDINDKIKLKLVNLVYLKLKYGQLAEFITFSLAAFLLWKIEKPGQLLVWYCMSVLLCGIPSLPS